MRRPFKILYVRIAFDQNFDGRVQRAPTLFDVPPGSLGVERVLKLVECESVEQDESHFLDAVVLLQK